MPSWWDRFGEEWAKNGLTDDPTFAQGEAGWAFIGQAPPTVEQFNSMFQWVDNKDNWLYGQIANCIIGSGVEPASNDLMQLWNAIKSLQRRKLDTDTAFYVDAINGNDVTGTGDINNPWKTIQHTLQYIYNYIDVAGRSAIIQLAPGTYTPFTHSQPVNGYLILQGDNLNPRAYLIKNTNGSAIAVVAGAVIYIQGIAVEASGLDVDYSSVGNGMFVDRSGIIIYDDVAFGTCSNFHVWVGVSGNFWPWRAETTTYSIYGGAKSNIYCSLSGAATVVKIQVTITGNPAFSHAFYYVNTGGYLQCWGMSSIGTAVGRKYYVDTGGLLNVEGQANTIIPGNQAGYLDSASYGMVI